MYLSCDKCSIFIHAVLEGKYLYANKSRLIIKMDYICRKELSCKDQRQHWQFCSTFIIQV